MTCGLNFSRSFNFVSASSNMEMYCLFRIPRLSSSRLFCGKFRGSLMTDILSRNLSPFSESALCHRAASRSAVLPFRAMVKGMPVEPLVERVVHRFMSTFREIRSFNGHD